MYNGKKDLVLGKKRGTQQLEHFKPATGFSSSSKSAANALVILYVDDSEESKEAMSLLKSQRIVMHVVQGGLDEGWKYPLAQAYTWEYEGLEEIRTLLDQIAHFEAQSLMSEQRA